jgi:hypothetical protein
VNETVVLTAENFVQTGNDQAETDDLRTSAEDGEDFH